MMTNLDPVFWIYAAVDTHGTCLTPFYRDSQAPEILQAVKDSPNAIVVRCKASVSRERKPSANVGRPMRAPRSEFEALLRSGMEAAGINTYAELARRLKCKPNLIQQWCNEASRPGLDHSVALKEVLGIDVPVKASATNNSLYELNEYIREQATTEELARMYKEQPVWVEESQTYEDPGVQAVRLRLGLPLPKRV